MGGRSVGAVREPPVPPQRDSHPSATSNCGPAPRASFRRKPESRGAGGREGPFALREIEG